MSALQKYRARQSTLNGTVKKLKAENVEQSTELAVKGAEIAALAPQCRTPTGRVGVALLQYITAYGTTRAYVALQQRGMVPAFPVDILLAVATQLGLAWSDSGWARIGEDVAGSVADGGFGRMALIHQLEKTEAGGRVMLLLPPKMGAPVTPDPAAT